MRDQIRMNELSAKLLAVYNFHSYQYPNGEGEPSFLDWVSDVADAEVDLSADANELLLYYPI